MIISAQFYKECANAGIKALLLIYSHLLPAVIYHNLNIMYSNHEGSLRSRGADG